MDNIVPRGFTTEEVSRFLTIYRGRINEKNVSVWRFDNDGRFDYTLCDENNNALIGPLQEEEFKQKLLMLA